MQDIIDVRKESSQPEQQKKKRSFKIKKKTMVPWLLLILVLVAGLAGTLYYKDRADEVESNPQAVQQQKNQAETDRVLTALKKSILVTEAEAPTVARVEDPEKLKSSNPSFYKDIQQGDYLVIFPKRAIVYRENIDQIINIAPIINTSELNAQQGTTPAETKKPAANTGTNR